MRDTLSNYLGSLSNYPLLNDNFILAKKRLDSQLKRLGKRPKLLDPYSTRINEQFENGITEEVDNSLPTVGIILPRLRTVINDLFQFGL